LRHQFIDVQIGTAEESSFEMPAMRRILVLSYYNAPNFGDRLGYHIVNAILPPGAEIHHCSVKPWSAPDLPFDMLVLGIGNSLNASTVRRDELFRLVERIPIRVGLFGTQYRTQYDWLAPKAKFDQLLDELTVWFARYRKDIAEFGAGRGNVRHLGDMLISAFPMARWSNPKTLTVHPDVKSRSYPLDRFIQEVQGYRRVKSFRLHPLLCALTSAEEVAYEEQTAEEPGREISGKFAAMLEDVFGAAFPADEFVPVDRAKVVAYKEEVRRNLDNVRQMIAELLA
jgi:hypothetical protein